MSRTRSTALAAALATALTAGLTPAVAEMAAGVRTDVTLLFGFPAEEAEPQGTLIVPGTVLPIQAGLALSGRLESEERHNQRVLATSNGLETTLRLENVQPAYSQVVALPLNEQRTLPGPVPGSKVEITIELLGFDDGNAAYRVRLAQPGEEIADTKVTIARGEQAVIGGRDGAEAPYLFVVVRPEPVSAALSGPPFTVTDDVLPPRALEKTPPRYPDEAREARLQGVVIIQAVIDSTGAVADVEVLKGLPLGLSEAAVEAIQQWRFEPATLAGKPVDVYYNLTVNFRLQEEPKEE